MGENRVHPRAVEAPCGEQPGATVPATAALSTGVSTLTAGMLVAAAIVVSAHGEDTIAETILYAAGVETADEARAAGVDEYDIEILEPVFAAMEARS